LDRAPRRKLFFANIPDPANSAVNQIETHTLLFLSLGLIAPEHPADEGWTGINPLERRSTMSMQGIGSGNFFGNVAPVSQAPGQSVAGGIDTDGDGDTQGSATRNGLSRSAQFLSKLQTLEQTDPAQAKQMLTDLAAKFRAEASQSGGTNSSKAQLADMFPKAADTGDLTPLLNASTNSSGSAATGTAAYSQMMAVTRASM
jgi:hypothetical protein